MKDVINFNHEVLEQSYTTPVLVDFWARWCNACKILSPSLEILKNRHKGEWSLVKVEVEDHPDLAIQYNISSIPSVKLFVDGKVIDEFTGALPGHVIEEWLQNALPPRYLRDLKKANTLIVTGHESEAELLLSNLIKNQPDTIEVKIYLAKSQVLQKPTQALELLKGMEGIGSLELTIESIRTIAKVLTSFRVTSELPQSPAKPHFLKAISALFSHDFDLTLEHLIESLKNDRTFLNGFAKEVCIALFNYLGEEHEITIKYRKLLGRVLF